MLSEVLNYQKIARCEYLVTQCTIYTNTSDLESCIQAILVSCLCVNISKKPNKNYRKTKPKLKQFENSGTKNSMFRVCVLLCIVVL